MAAAGLNLAAAVLGLVAARTPAPPAAARTAPAEPPAGTAPAALGAAAAVAGGVLLALETVWFRLLSQFSCSTSLGFATMLAAVLAGIGGGGLLGGAVLARWPRAARGWPLLGAAAGIGVVASYATLFPPGGRACGGAVFLLASRLVLPTSLASGALFSWLGAALRASCQDAAGAVGRLTFANTLGAVGGALAGPWLLLPALGVEGSLFVLAFAYGAVMVCALFPAGAARAPRGLLWPAVGVWAIALLLFPTGAMARRLLPLSLAPFADMRLLAVREGPTETAAFLVHELWERPVAYRLVTNGFSMAGTGWNAERYTRLFAYWPAVFHPQARKVLLISYGVGSTAAALTANPTYTSIEMVDISADVFALNAQVRPHGRDPLADPRVRTVVEDGRQHLLLSRGGYDVITGEPPPPLNAGIVNLYSREYFALVRDRLATGGVATYWLPVHSLPWDGSRAVVAAFCGAFPDCTVWSAYGYDWMLAGSRGGLPPAAAEDLDRIFSGPLGPEMARQGFETPADLGATFVGDSLWLAQFAAGAAPVEDDHPYRLGQQGPPSLQPYAAVVAGTGPQVRFAASRWVAEHWPREWRTRTLEAFPRVRVMNQLGTSGLGSVSPGEALDILRGNPGRVLTLWLAGVTEEMVAAVEGPGAAGRDDALVHRVRGAEALAVGDRDRARSEFARAAALAPGDMALAAWSALASCLTGVTGDCPARAP